jgi:hypothetical protein
MSRPEILTRFKKSRIGWTVMFRRVGSHDSSEGERLDALRILGRGEGQSTSVGVYPSGASGVARSIRVPSSEGCVTGLAVTTVLEAKTRHQTPNGNENILLNFMFD